MKSILISSNDLNMFKVYGFKFFNWPFPGAHLELCDLGIEIKKLGNDPSLVTGYYLQDFLPSQTIPCCTMSY